jgi:hypothetical protein
MSHNHPFTRKLTHIYNQTIQLSPNSINVEQSNPEHYMNTTLNNRNAIDSIMSNPNSNFSTFVFNSVNTNSNSQSQPNNTNNNASVNQPQPNNQGNVPSNQQQDNQPININPPQNNLHPINSLVNNLRNNRGNNIDNQNNNRQFSRTLDTNLSGLYANQNQTNANTTSN